VKIPDGYRLQWSGEYEYLVKTHERLKVVLPLTALIIFVLIFLNTQSITKTMIVLPAIRLLAAIYRAGDLSLSRLRESAQRFCPCEMQRLRPRIFVGIFLQTASFLPILPPETGGGIRGVALHGCPQKDSSPAFRIKHPQNPPPLLSV